MRNMAYEHIKKELEKQGKTQIEMASILGRTHAIATSIFNGSRPLKIDEIPLLAKWLGKPENFILHGIDDTAERQYISELDECHAHLDTAIRLWFEDGANAPSAAIYTLALAAYRILFPGEIRVVTDKEKIEGLILATIMELQLKGEQLTRSEIAFILWFSANDETLSKNQLRIFSSQFISAKGASKVGKPDKLTFFKTFLSESHGKGKGIS